MPRAKAQMCQSGAEVNPEVLRYFNRIADLLFVLARQAAGDEEPGSRG